MATKRDLEQTVKFFNNKYCKNTKNELKISQAYGGYSVCLTGKKNKRTGKPLKGSIGTVCASVGYQDYHDSATKTIENLYKSDARGWIKSAVRSHEPKRTKYKRKWLNGIFYRTRKIFRKN